VDGMNLYEYASSNPIEWSDPTGLWKVVFEGPGWSDDRKLYFSERLSEVSVGLNGLVTRVDELIKKANEVTRECCFRERLLKNLRLWKKGLLRPMQKKFARADLALPVRNSVLPSDVRAQAVFGVSAWLFGHDITNFKYIELNKNNFYENANKATTTLFHELTHIDGTIDNNGETAASVLWNAHNIDWYVHDPSGVTLAFYFLKLKEELGTSNCTEGDKQWPKN
jgi:hypothetical protein